MPLSKQKVPDMRFAVSVPATDKKTGKPTSKYFTISIKNGKVSVTSGASQRDRMRSLVRDAVSGYGKKGGKTKPPTLKDRIAAAIKSELARR